MTFLIKRNEAIGGTVEITNATTVRRQLMRRLRSGEKVTAVAAHTGVSRSTLYRWKRQSMRTLAKTPAVPRPAATAVAAMPCRGLSPSRAKWPT